MFEKQEFAAPLPDPTPEEPESVPKPEPLELYIGQKVIAEGVEWGIAKLYPREAKIRHLPSGRTETVRRSTFRRQEGACATAGTRDEP